MAQITENRYYKLQEELLSWKEAYEEATKVQEKARDMGDLRENEEYHIARAEAEEAQRKIIAIEEELRTATVIARDYSSRITLGSIVDVTKVTKEGQPLEATRRFTLETKGDTITQKILSVSSPLGATILNGTDGIYRVINNGGIYYQVKKVRE